MSTVPDNPAVPPVAAPASMKRRAVKGSFWTLVGYSTGQPIRLAGNIVLTRLLPLEVFGLMLLVNAINRGLVMLSDAGIRTYLIQSDEAHERTLLNTAWSIQLLRGVAIFAIMLGIAYPVSMFYGEPRIMMLLPIVGLVAIVTGAMSISFLTIQKSMELGRVTIIEVTGQITSVIAMIVWASISPTVYALAFGGVFGAIAKVILSYAILDGGFHRFSIDRPTAMRIFSFGKWIAMSTALTFFAMQSDRLIISKMAGAEQAGIYAIALGLSQMVRDLVTKLSARILLPAMSERKSLRREQFSARIEKYRRPALLALVLPIAGLAVFGDLIIELLYDDRYLTAGPILQVFALGLWPLMLALTIDRATVALGDPKYNAYGAFFRLIFIAVAMPFGYMHYGLIGAAAGVALADIPTYAAGSFGRLKYKVGGFRTDALASIAFGVTLGLFWWFKAQVI